MRLLASASSICLAPLTRNRRIPFYGSPSTPTIRRHKFTQWTSNILHYPPFSAFYSLSLKTNAFYARCIPASRVAGCSQTAFPRVLDNSLGRFQLPGMDAILSICLPLFGKLCCNLHFSLGGEVHCSQRYRVQKQQLHFVQSATHA